MRARVFITRARARPPWGMHAVEDYVSALCHMRYNGGRVKSLDANTLIL